MPAKTAYSKRKWSGTFVSGGFTIVELIVVIIAIGILALAIIFGYVGLNEKAKVAAMKYELSNSAKKIEMSKDSNGNEDFPSTIDCTQAESQTNTCLSFSGITGSNSVTYTTYDATYTTTNPTHPKHFKLTIKRDGLVYYITDSNPTPTLATVPILTVQAATGIGTTTATLNATIISDGGDDMTDYGFCWGTSPNPTNCTAMETGMLTTLSPATIALAASPAKMTISSDGKNAYVTGSSNPGKIYMFSRDTSTGQLTAMTPDYASLGYYSETAIVVSPDGRFAYAMSHEISNAAYIRMFSRDTSTGLLTALSPAAYGNAGVPQSPTDLAISLDGKFLYATGGNSNLFRYTLDTTSGQITSNASFNCSTTPKEIEISPDNLHLYCAPSSDISIYGRDLDTGNLSGLGSGTLSSGSIGIAISPDGNNLYATILLNNRVAMFSRNHSTGLLTALSPSTIPTGSGTTNPRGIAISPDGKTIYISNKTTSEIAMFSRNPSTGLLTPLSTPTISSDDTWSVVISPDGKYVYSINSTPNVIAMYSRSTTVSLGPFSMSISGLTTGTTYHFRGYATNGVGTGYSPDQAFTTL